MTLYKLRPPAVGAPTHRVADRTAKPDATAKERWAEMSTIEWTPERIAALIALWNESLPTSEIGRRLGITKNAVIGKVHRLGLTKRRPSQKVEIEPARLIRLDSLSSSMCSWPVGNPGEDSFHFCGEAVVAGKPYCARHCAVAYIKTSSGQRDTSGLG